MFRSVFNDVNTYIKERVTTLTGAELYSLKNEFYESCYEYMGHTNDLTGITELLINMYLVNYLNHKGFPYNLKRNYPCKGVNGHDNELDIAILNESNVVLYGFSIKREIGSAGWKQHELSSDICILLRAKYGKNNIVQDLYRLDNIKRGDSGSFPSVTFIFEGVNRNAFDKLSKIEAGIGFAHGYVVLEGNTEKLWDVISLKLHL
ncbi:hypothetical protein [Bacillus bombysepticus]|uniref:hypothetical protein n=1 Tax=Bacillus bombysepticus TaxID=658666 RepID=UPI003019F4CC